MATRISAGLSVAEGRKFGLTVGAAFVALGLVAWWRGHEGASRAAITLGVALMSLGIVAPSRLGYVQYFWMELAGVLSKITTPVFMAVVWLVAVTPTALVRRMLGKNAMVRTQTAGSYWVSRAADADQRTGMERQF